MYYLLVRPLTPRSGGPANPPQFNANALPRLRVALLLVEEDERWYVRLGCSLSPMALCIAESFHNFVQHRGSLWYQALALVKWRRSAFSHISRRGTRGG